LKAFDAAFAEHFVEKGHLVLWFIEAAQFNKIIEPFKEITELHSLLPFKTLKLLHQHLLIFATDFHRFASGFQHNPCRTKMICSQRFSQIS
jgi:hypothetical protein